MFPDVKVHRYEFLNSSRLSSPTCEDLGIPCEDTVLFPGKTIRHPALQLDGIRYESLTKADPFSPLSMIPLPSTFGFDAMEPTFIRKRNERERDRVRCVNDGYSKLKEHLPIENKDKRISKVETLRSAIDYIKSLRAMLEESDSESGHGESGHGEKRCHDCSETDSDDCVTPEKKRLKRELEPDNHSDTSSDTSSNET